MNRNLKWVPILLLVWSNLIQAQNLTSSFAKLSTQDIIFADPDGVKMPGDGRLWVIVIFKCCCASNQRAVHWALETEKVFGDSVGFLGINSDYARALSKVKPWLSANKVDFTVFQDPSHEVINALQIMAVPTIIVLDAEGNEDFRSAGFFWGSGGAIRERLTKMLDKNHTDRNQEHK